LRKIIQSFSCDQELWDSFIEVTPHQTRSKTIESLIKQFLKDKSPEGSSIPSGHTENSLIASKEVI